MVLNLKEVILYSHFSFPFLMLSSCASHKHECYRLVACLNCQKTEKIKFSLGSIVAFNIQSRLGLVSV